jgi:hypothetical protein
MVQSSTVIPDITHQHFHSPRGRGSCDCFVVASNCVGGFGQWIDPNSQAVHDFTSTAFLSERNGEPYQEQTIND